MTRKKRRASSTVMAFGSLWPSLGGLANRATFFLTRSQASAWAVALLVYKEGRDRKRLEALDEVTRISDELGLYDE